MGLAKKYIDLKNNAVYNSSAKIETYIWQYITNLDLV